MAQTTWEKTTSNEGVATARRKGGQWKFLVGGVLILAAVAYLMISGTASGARYFMTIDDLLGSSKYVGQTVRISGAVIGSTIDYKSEQLTIDFTIANVPVDAPDLAAALHQAASDPKAAQLKVHIEGQVKPDLLQNEAQAIVTGKLGADGVFRASELLLKCPSRFEEADPQKAIGVTDK